MCGRYPRSRERARRRMPSPRPAVTRARDERVVAATGRRGNDEQRKGHDTRRHHQGYLPEHSKGPRNVRPLPAPTPAPPAPLRATSAGCRARSPARGRTWPPRPGGARHAPPGAARRSGPTSPKHASGAAPRRAATPRAALATASATARSAPGSSTRTPPATLTNTSALPTPTPAWRAEHREHEREAVAVDPVDHPPRRHELRRRHERLDLDQQRPRALHRGEHDAARRPRRLPHEARRGVEPPRPGRRSASRTRRPRWSSRSGSSARAACGRCARARPRTAARSRRGARARAGPRARPPWSRGRRAARRSPRAFASRVIRSGDLAHLADRARRAGQLAPRAASAPSRSRRPRAARPRASPAPRRGRSRPAPGPRSAAPRQPLGAQPDLRRRLLARDVERAPAGAGEVAERHRRSASTCRSRASRR